MRLTGEVSPSRAPVVTRFAPPGRTAVARTGSLIARALCTPEGTGGLGSVCSSIVRII